MSPLSFVSPLFYSVQNEDYATELALLARQDPTTPKRVLMIASSGENILSVLTDPSVAELHAVDVNPAQLHLCDLRRAALMSLSRDEHLQLFASDAAPYANGGERRIALYERTRAALADDARDFWDSRRDQEIAFGIHFVGRNDVLMRDLVLRLRNVGFSPLVEVPDPDSLAEWRSAYLDVMTPGYIKMLFGMESESLAARIAGIAGYLGECHFNALRQPDAHLDPFVTTVFDQRYAFGAGEAGLPLYLQADAYRLLRDSDLHARLRLYTANLTKILPQLVDTYGKFDLISISNIADWMSDVQFTALTLDVRDCLAPGGMLLARTGTPSRMIQGVMRDYLNGDDVLNAELAEIERGPWFRILAAGVKTE